MDLALRHACGRMCGKRRHVAVELCCSSVVRNGVGMHAQPHIVPGVLACKGADQVRMPVSAPLGWRDT